VDNKLVEKPGIGSHNINDMIVNDVHDWRHVSLVLCIKTCSVPQQETCHWQTAGVLQLNSQLAVNLQFTTMFTLVVLSIFTLNTCYRGERDRNLVSHITTKMHQAHHFRNGLCTFYTCLVLVATKTVLLLLICVSQTISGQPQNSIFIRRV